jgi:KUP system potassium uptake protein
MGALGVVFGDIGTSPLYAVQTVFSIDDNAVSPTPGDVYGVVSLIFWSVTLVVTVKYVSLVLRADMTARAGSWRSPRWCRPCCRGPRPGAQRWRSGWAWSGRRSSTVTR